LPFSARVAVGRAATGVIIDPKRQLILSGQNIDVNLVYNQNEMPGWFIPECVMRCLVFTSSRTFSPTKPVCRFVDWMVRGDIKQISCFVVSSLMRAFFTG
jgi:hypothetical protein